MAANVNKEGNQRHFAVVQELLHERGLKAFNISALAYNEDYQYPFNNFLFKVELAIPASTFSFPGTQPGTCEAPPEGVSTLVVKFSNAAAHDVNNANRVANDVAAQLLVRQSMAKAGLAPLIPDVYAWAPAMTTNKADETESGWIMSEFRGGVDLGPEFSSLEPKSQKHALETMACVLGAIQTAELPEGVSFQFGGGLNFDSNGCIVSGESPTIQDVRPSASYMEWRAGKLRSQLKQAAESLVIEGWKTNNVASRIETFFASGGPAKLLSIVNVHQKCLIHGDLTIHNMLFDMETKKVTAVLDFDFASISHPFDEFISMSFSDTGGNVSDEDTEINRAILAGEFTTPPIDLDEQSVKEWELAGTWNDVLRESVALAPSQIAGVNEIRALMQLQRLLCPYRLSSADVLEELGDEKRAKMREQAEEDLVGWLREYGF